MTGQEPLDNKHAMRAIVAYLSGQEFGLSVSEIRWEMEMTDGMSAAQVDVALAELVDEGRVVVDGPYVRLASSGSDGPEAG